MTIIGPDKAAKVANKMLIVSLASLVAIAVGSIFVYNQTVNLSHELKDKEKEHQSLLTMNAELKNKRYNMTDVKNLAVIAKESGLVKVPNVEYIELDQNPPLASR